MKRAVVIALTVLFALGLAGPVLAKGFGGRALCGALPGRGPVELAEVIAGLGLSDDQVAKIQALQQDAYEKLQSLRVPKPGGRSFKHPRLVLPDIAEELFCHVSKRYGSDA